MSPLRTVLLSALGAAAIAVSACGTNEPGSEAEAAAPTEATTRFEASATETTSEPEEDAAQAQKATDAQVTAPGTQLKIGEPAIVPYESGSKTGLIEITVTAVEKGDTAAFRKLYGSRADGIVPIYVRYTVKNVDGSDLSSTSSPLLNAIAEGGGSTGAVVTGDMAGCERERASDEFTTAGASYETCRLQGAREGITAVGAEYDDEDYNDDPIIWTK